MLAPPTRLLALSGVVRSFLIGTLVLSLPLVTRLPGTAVAFASGAWWLPWAPPAWFVGFERWLIGDASRFSLAAQAGTATVLVLAVSVATYALLYRRFDWVVLQPAVPMPPAVGAGRSIGGLGAYQCGTPSVTSLRSRYGGAFCTRGSWSASWPPAEGSC